MASSNIEYQSVDHQDVVGVTQHLVYEFFSLELSKMESRTKRLINECIEKHQSHDWGRGLCRKDAARYVGLSPSKLDSLIGDGRMPKPVKIDGRVVWDRHDLDECFELLKEPNYSDSNSWFENEPRKEGWS